MYYIKAKEHGQILAINKILKNTEFDMTIMAAAPGLYAILQEILDNAVINYVYREKAEKIMAEARGEVEQ